MAEGACLDGRAPIFSGFAEVEVAVEFGLLVAPDDVGGEGLRLAKTSVGVNKRTRLDVVVLGRSHVVVAQCLVALGR